jgi:hypothetical protein
MKTDVKALRGRLPAGAHPLLSPVLLASQPEETARFMPMQYVPSEFYGTTGMACGAPPRAISRLLSPADIAELAAHRQDAVEDGDRR